MKSHEFSSKRLATIAGRILKGGHWTPPEVRALAASVLTQAPDKKVLLDQQAQARRLRQISLLVRKLEALVEEASHSLQ